MDNKKKAILIITVAAVVTALLYFTIFHPYVKNIILINQCYKEFHVDDLGSPAVLFTEYEVTNPSFARVEAPDYSISLPAYFTDNTKDGSEIIVYKAEEDDNGFCESIGFGGYGNDHSDMAILSHEDLTERAKEKLIDGYETLGYGIPDTCYSSLKCSYLITEDDFSFFDRNKLAAYTLLVPYRTGAAFYYTDGISGKTYIYETEEVYAFIAESYHPEWDLYFYMIDIYNPTDLNTSYVITMNTKSPQTAYAIINSIEFKD